MAKITRQNLKIFGADGATANFGKFGSQAAGSAVTTKDIEIIQDSTAWDNGFQDALTVGKAPYLQDMNGLLLVLATQLSYILQDGISEWNTDTSYYIGSIVKKTGTFEMYGSRVNDNLGNSLPSGTDDASWAFLGSLQTRQAGAFKNKTINGNFDFWQRGTEGTTSGYLADRFKNDATGSTFAASRQSFTLGQTDVPNEPKYFYRNVVISSAGSSNFCNFYQPIESVRTLAGKKATISFYAKADSAKNIAIDFSQNFGSGGSPSSPVSAIGSQKFALTTSWAKFTATIDIPTITGKTLGTDNNDRLDLVFWFDAGSNFNARAASLGQQSGTFDIAQIQLEEGTISTNFDIRNIGQEYELCRGFYRKSYGQAVSPGTSSVSGISFIPTRTDFFPNSVSWEGMHKTPTVKLYSPNSGTIDKVYQFDGAGSPTDVAATVILRDNSFDIVATLVNGANFGFCVTLDSEY